MASSNAVLDHGDGSDGSFSDTAYCTSDDAASDVSAFSDLSAFSQHDMDDFAAGSAAAETFLHDSAEVAAALTYVPEAPSTPPLSPRFAAVCNTFQLQPPLHVRCCEDALSMEEGLLGSPTEDVREYALFRLRSSQPACSAASPAVASGGTPCCGALRCSDAGAAASSAPAKRLAVSYDPGSLVSPTNLRRGRYL